LESALDEMHKYVDRLTLHDTCDTENVQSLLVVSPEFDITNNEKGNRNRSGHGNEIQTKSDMMKSAIKSAGSDRSIGSRVLHEVCQTGYWSSDSPMDPSPMTTQYVNQVPRGYELGRGYADSDVENITPANYWGMDSQSSIVREAHANGVWEASSVGSKASMISFGMLTSENVKRQKNQISPPVRELRRDFGESPIIPGEFF